MAASSSIFCEGENTAVDVAIGSLPVLRVLGAHISFGDRAWSTGPERGEGIPIVVGQAYGDGDIILIDFTDPNIEKVLLTIRLEYGDGEDWPLRGVLVVDRAAHDIDCGDTWSESAT